MIREILTSQPQQTLQHINPSHQDEPFQTTYYAKRRQCLPQNIFIYNLKQGMYPIHIPKDMYLHDISLCMY